MDIIDAPPKLVEAFIAVEDRRFHQHYGIDLRRLVNERPLYVALAGAPLLLGVLGSMVGRLIMAALALLGEDSPPERTCSTISSARRGSSSRMRRSSS